MNNKTKLTFLGVSTGIFLGLSLWTIPINAATFTPLDVIGKGITNITYPVDDTKGITNYSGVDKYRVGVDSEAQFNSLLSTEPWLPATDESKTVVTRTNKGSLVAFDYTVPTSFRDGKHFMCLQTMDDTEKIINGNYQIGNISEASCKRFYYDITPPEMTSIKLNNNNRYSNKSTIPVKMSITDNYAGLRSISYNNGNGGTSTIPASDLKCSQNTTAGGNEGRWNCTIDSTITINSDRAEDNVTFLLEDMVGNTTWTKPVNLRFDKILPSGTLEIHNDGEGVVNSDKGYIEYHVKDTINDMWIYPSGLTKVSVMEADGSHEEVLLNEPDVTTNKKTTLDGMLTDYLLTTCHSGEMNVKLFLADRAGNYTGDALHPEEVIVSNKVVCSKAKVSRFEVTDVVNPNKFTESIPFAPLSWVFNDDSVTPEGMKDGQLAPLLAGASTSFEYDVEWTGDIKAKATSVYTIYVKNEEQRYERSFSGSITAGSFHLDPNGKKYATFKDTITLPKDAPTSSNDDRGRTEVTIKATVTIATVEGGKNKVTKSTALFDKYGHEALWGKITGSIDDYLWFGETN